MKGLQWKRLAAVCAAAALMTAMLFTGCDQQEVKDDKEQSQGGGYQRGEIAENVEISPAKNLQIAPEDYPVVDGSTATIPLSEGFAASVMQTTVEEARQYILHNTTHDAYINLVDGKADIIFVTSPSQEELDYAGEQGVTLQLVPIVNEGFIFLTAAENPVNDLSFQQVQDIYRGKITNWKEVGGSDTEIIAYQRPTNSGSQTGMYDLVVPENEIAKAPTEMRMQGMGDLVEAVADYENSPGAMGYSYYYYVTDMWINEGVKLLSVDGVKPTPATISDETYPIMTHYYAVIRGDEPEDSDTSKLLSWILSDEGQSVAKQAGYIPMGKGK